MANETDGEMAPQFKRWSTQGRTNVSKQTEQNGESKWRRKVRNKAKKPTKSEANTARRENQNRPAKKKEEEERREPLPPPAVARTPRRASSLRSPWSFSAGPRGAHPPVPEGRTPKTAGRPRGTAAARRSSARARKTRARQTRRVGARWGGWVGVGAGVGVWSFDDFVQRGCVVRRFQWCQGKPVENQSQRR